MMSARDPYRQPAPRPIPKGAIVVWDYTLMCWRWADRRGIVFSTKS